MIKSILTILIVLQSSFALSQDTQADDTNAELCSALYPETSLQICLKETTYPTFSLIADNLEMAKRNIQNKNEKRALMFVEKAQILLGVGSPERKK